MAATLRHEDRGNPTEGRGGMAYEVIPIGNVIEGVLIDHNDVKDQPLLSNDRSIDCQRLLL